MSAPAILPPGSIIEIIAPSGKPETQALSAALETCQAYGWQPIVDPNILGPDLLCANGHSERLRQLKNALSRDGSHAIWPLRGGYGCSPLIPDLYALPKPKQFKWVLGLSDITALHIFVQQAWQWPSLHCPSISQFALKKISDASLYSLSTLLQGSAHYSLPLEPMNAAAKNAQPITAPIIGGNLTLVQASLGTCWQLNADHKILLLEEVNEAAYRIDRMLHHLAQAKCFNKVKAILFADFLIHNKRDDQTQAVLKHWAHTLPVPVLQLKNVGHGHENLSVPLGTDIQLDLGLLSHLSWDSAATVSNWRPEQESNL